MNTNEENQKAGTPAEKCVTTRLHRYSYDLYTDEGREAWERLQAELGAKGVKCQEMWGDLNGPASLPDGAQESVEEIVIDLSHIFSNQWNTIWPEPQGKCNGERVHDWYKYYEVRGRKCARGHWVEITPQLQAAREQTSTCAYCGKHYGPMHAKAPTNGFCDACLDSPYLKETELKLLRLVPLSEERNYSDDTLPEGLRQLYVERQTTGANSRANQRKDKQRQSVLDEYQEKVDSVTKANGNAVIERDGKLWLWERGVDLENVIYYSHTQSFEFFWRNKYSGGPSQSVKEKMVTLLESERFPYKYQIAKADK